MIVNYVVLDAEGRVLRSGLCPVWDLPLQAQATETAHAVADADVAREAEHETSAGLAALLATEVEVAGLAQAALSSETKGVNANANH